MNKIFRGQVVEGKLIFDNRESFLAALPQYEGKRVEVVLRKHRETRTDNQNRYYWGVVIKTIADYCGYLPDEMHEALKQKFLSDGYEDQYGLKKTTSTTRLSTDEFIQYTNKIVMWAATELSVYIPDPGGVDF